MVKQLTISFLQMFSCITILLMAVSCDDHEPRPEPEPQPVAGANERLLLASSCSNGLGDAQYNADNRPKSFTLVDLKHDVTITYAANSATYTTSEQGKITRVKVFELENNVAKKAVEYSVDDNGNQIEIGTKLYLYNNGKLSKEESFQNNVLVTYINYIYDQGYDNLVEKRIHAHDGTLIQKTTYQYTNILDMSVLFNEWDFGMEGSLFPKRSKYLIQSRKREGVGSQSSFSTFTYVLDAQGYVTSGTETPDGGTDYTWTNTWQ